MTLATPTLLGAAAALAVLVGALVLQVYRLTEKVKKLEQAREVERRHRERLTGQVERLEDRAAGGTSKPETEVLRFAVRGCGPKVPQ